MPYPKRETTRLHIAGLVIDSSRTDLSAYSRTRMEAAEPEILPLPANIGDYQGEISLGGVLYTSIFNPHDGRKNWSEMITAFCVAMRDREDATLLLKFTHYAPHDLIPDMLKTIYKMGRLACRILMIHSYLQQPEYDALLAATTYAVNTSHGEGQCLPLMEYMAAGIPAIAPRHTSMLDYIDADCAFVIDSSAELGTWPHDQRQAYRTLRQRIHFQSLVEAFQRSYHVARHEPETYAAMAAAAVESQKNYCSVAVVRSRLEQFMQERLANDAGGHTTPAPQQHA
jgi:glycosyltransferase involved in cell wall biosynthesis